MIAASGHARGRPLPAPLCQEEYMRTDTAKPVRLKDYRVPDYLIDNVDLDVKLHPSATKVEARLAIRPNPQGRQSAPLVLDGDALIAKKMVLDRGLLDLQGPAAC